MLLLLTVAVVLLSRQNVRLNNVVKVLYLNPIYPDTTNMRMMMSTTKTPNATVYSTSKRASNRGSHHRFCACAPNRSNMMHENIRNCHTGLVMMTKKKY